MKLYTSKVVAAWLGLTERRVRQLRDEGVISEKQPGLYDLQATVTKYITFLRNGSGKINLNDERAGLTRAKREAAEMENKLRMGELHRTQDIEAGLKTVFLNIRERYRPPRQPHPQCAKRGAAYHQRRCRNRRCSQWRCHLTRGPQRQPHPALQRHGYRDCFLSKGTV